MITLLMRDDRFAVARWSGWTLLALALLVPPTDLMAREDKSVAVRGRVTDATGAAVPGHTVRLLKSRTIVNLGSFQKRDQNVEEMRSTTNAHGFFEFNFPLDKKFRYYYLRFYDPADFDLVKYRVPDDKDISRRARKGRAVQVDLVLDLQAEWPKVEAQIREYGAGTPRGQILRSLGLPARRLPQGPGRELWEYDDPRVSYLIEGGKVLETRRDPASQGGGADGGEVPVGGPETRPPAE